MLRARFLSLWLLDGESCTLRASDVEGDIHPHSPLSISFVTGHWVFWLPCLWLPQTSRFPFKDFSSGLPWWHQFCFPFLLVAAALKMVQAPARVPFFPRVTEQLSWVSNVTTNHAGCPSICLAGHVATRLCKRLPKAMRACVCVTWLCVKTNGTILG